MGFVIIASIIGTSLWVYFDAKWIGIYRTDEPRSFLQFSLDMEPVDWLISCVLLWIVAFPAYLVTRPGFIRKFHRTRAHSVQPPIEPVEYFYDQLRNLSKLRQQGLITEKEFTLKRKEVLGL